MRGLYVHVPFCVSKCAYCDFYSLAAREESINAYVEAVRRECDAHSGMSFSTLYLGGGTPSLLGARSLSNLIHGLRRAFDLSHLVEGTIEVNPESATADLLKAASDAGIDRVSVGVQSLADSEFRSVGRVHTATQALQAVDRAVKLGFSTSADLIIGLPGQEWPMLHSAIDTLADLGVRHLSLYCLSLEESTPLAAAPPADLPSADMQAELFERARLILERRGFIHYEISNFALPGYECRHNLNYWRGGEYLGLGPGAASHLSGKRYKNRPDLDAYLEDPTGQTEEIEELGPREKAAEEAMLRLRLLSEGLDPGELAARFGHEAVHELAGRLAGMTDAGLLLFDGSSYRLPPGRVLTSNPILAGVLSG